MPWLKMRTRAAALRPLVVVASLLAPVLGGSFIYYSLRKTHPATAHFANVISFAGFFAWTALVPWDWARHDGRMVIAVVVAIGVMAAELSVRLVRNTEGECEPAATTVAPPPNEELKPTATPSHLVE